MAAAGKTTYVLAIDLGSSGPKVVIVSDTGELVGHASDSIETMLTPDGGGEQDPDQWWSATTACVRRLVAERIVPIEKIVAVSCASQWSVTVPVDAQGRHLMNAIHWTDSRGAVHTKRVTDGLVNVSGYGIRQLIQWVRLTGGVPTHSGADALAHILFIRHERPDVYRQTFKLLEPMDYLNFRLTGKAAASYATVFPYLLTDNRDSTRIDYNDGLIAACGLDRQKLPDLLRVGSVLGPLLPQAAEEWGLARTTQVVTGTPDSQAAALGSGAVRDFEPHVCVGTTAWLSCHVPFKKTNLFSYLATMPSAIHGRNMVTAEQGAAGKCLSAFVDNWLFPPDELTPDGAPADVYQRIERLVSGVPPGSDGLLFLPWLNGAGPPSGESAIRGGFLNQSLRTDRAHALRAIMEGVAFNLRWLRGSVERFAGRRFHSLNLIGGCARMDLWCQTLADILDRPLQRAVDPHMATSRGAALAALVGLGRISVDKIPSLVRIDRTFVPNAEHRRLYEELFAALLASYKATRPVFRRLGAPRARRLISPTRDD
ncbi:MAG TPA: FGGY-family carbohydrate kinase [Pirellulales bacterium]|nr:FGGY-family carbohydrate kinase [Pirellulales bacterium]